MTSEQIRPYIWNKIDTEEELLQYDIFRDLHKLFLQLEAEPITYPMDELKIMNEVGFGVEWIRFSDAVFCNALLDQLEREVYADTGLKEHAEAALALMFATMAIADKRTLDVSPFILRELQTLVKDSWCYKIVNKYVSNAKRRVKHPAFPFSLSQEAAKAVTQITENLKNTITQGIEKTLTTYQVDEERLTTYCAEEVYEEKKPRNFSLDEIINYAVENLNLDTSAIIQNMLYNLMVEDGTKEERLKVASITKGIKEHESKSNMIGQMIHQQVNIGDTKEPISQLSIERVQKLLNL